MRQTVSDMQMPQQPQPPHEEHHRMSLVWGILVLVVVIIGALWLLGGRTDDRMFDKDGNEIVEARAGQFINGFPSELIREDDVAPETSYAINYANDGRRLLQARYLSELSFDQNVELFRNTLDELGWTFTRYEPNEQPIANLVATKGGAEVSVTVVFKTDSAVSVEIAYLSPSTNPEVIAGESEVMEESTEEVETMEESAEL